MDTTILAVAESIGTAAFSISGAAMAVKKKMDLFGVIMMGITTAFCGGMLRDLLMGQIPPRIFYSGGNMLLAVISAVAVFLIYDWRYQDRFLLSWKYFDQITNIFDAIGLGAFVILGTQTGIGAGYGDNLMLCACLGTLTGVGGGMVRDVFCGEIPGVFRKHIYAVAAIAGSICYYFLVRLGVALLYNLLLTMVLVLAIRIVASVYRLNLPRVHEKEKE